MKQTILFLLIIISSNNYRAQSYNKVNEFGKFQNASSFAITMNGIIYVTDSYKNELYKLDTLGNVLTFIGGYGWDTSQFDDPVDVFATPLNVYVADKNNNRIQIFDKDLNFLSVITTSDNTDNNFAFGYPSSVGVSGQGDMFILDSDNDRILKYDLSGNFSQEIGGVDAGEFSISSPIKFAVSKNGNVFVLESGYVDVFDQYGNGLFKLKTNSEVENINITFSYLTLVNPETVSIINLANRNKIFNQFKFNDNQTIIADGLVFNNKLYILTRHSIFVFQIEQEH